MLEIGSVVNATVSRIEPYGAYFDGDGKTVNVLAPELAWTDHADPLERFKVGDKHDVLVLHYNYAKKETVGSLRRLLVEENPYRQLSCLEPDAILQGTVETVFKYNAAVRLENGASASVRLSSETLGRIKAGAHKVVTIADIDVDEGRLIVQLLPHQEKAPDSKSSIELAKSQS